jgi:septal ring factor EnvC (AmiA/AmiB activator)
VAPQLSPPQPPGPTEAAAQLAALPAVPEPPALRGSSLPFPVHGEIVERFGEALAGGGEGLGIRIEASAGAQVVAPRDGEVVFAGPFRSYGRLLILEHDDGYHSLLSGFSRIDSEVGQSVRAGEPVGSVANGAEGASFLYVEIRRDTQPIDPIPWLLSGIRKVNG